MNNKIFRYIIYFVLIICFFLLFFGGPNYYSSRSYKRIWDLGHIFYFAILSYVLLRRWMWISKKKPMYQFLIIISFLLLIGFTVEVIQQKFSRLMEIGDLWRDLLGILFGIFFFSKRGLLIRPILLYCIKLAILIGILMEFISPVVAILDERIARNQFPILSNFETPFEYDRWEVDGKIRKTDMLCFEGHHCLSVSLIPKKYSGLTLKYFPRDWHNYEYFKFSIFNPSHNVLRLGCRIHDLIHVSLGEPYHDRFNKKLKLIPGWNTINIPLSEIENAPRDRKIQLSSISNFRIFVADLDSILDLYIDDVNLVQ